MNIRKIYFKKYYNGISEVPEDDFYASLLCSITYEWAISENECFSIEDYEDISGDGDLEKNWSDFLEISDYVYEHRDLYMEELLDSLSNYRAWKRKDLVERLEDDDYSEIVRRLSNYETMYFLRHGAPRNFAGGENKEKLNYLEEQFSQDNISFEKRPLDLEIGLDDRLGTFFSVRAYNRLARAGINTLGKIMEKTESDFLRVRNLGRECTEEVLKFQEYVRRHPFLFSKEENVIDCPFPLEFAKLLMKQGYFYIDEIIEERDTIEQFLRNAGHETLRIDFLNYLREWEVSKKSKSFVRLYCDCIYEPVKVENVKAPIRTIDKCSAINQIAFFKYRVEAAYIAAQIYSREAKVLLCALTDFACKYYLAKIGCLEDIGLSREELKEFEEQNQETSIDNLLYTLDRTLQEICTMDKTVFELLDQNKRNYSLYTYFNTIIRELRGILWDRKKGDFLEPEDKDCN